MKRFSLTLLTIIWFGCVADARAVDHGTASMAPNSLDMTCAQAQHYITKMIKRTSGRATRGAAGAATKRRFATPDQTRGSAPGYVRTKDTNTCLVGLSCNCHTGYCPQSYWQGVD